MPSVLGVIDGSYQYGNRLRKKGKFVFEHKTFSRSYYVLADNTNQGRDEILLTSGLPPLYYLQEGCYCKERNPRELQTVHHPSTGTLTVLWEVECKFDSDLDLDQEDETPPEARTPKHRWTGEEGKEPLLRDAFDGSPIETVNHEPLFAERPVCYPILEIRRYEFWPFDPAVIYDYAFHVNAQEFWGAPMASALMMPMDVEEETIEGVRYAHVTYRIKFRIEKVEDQVIDGGWDLVLLHHGYKVRQAKGGEIETAEDKKGNPISQNLDEDGVAIPDGGDPYFLAFNRFPYADFNALTLGPFETE